MSIQLTTATLPPPSHSRVEIVRRTLQPHEQDFQRAHHQALCASSLGTCERPTFRASRRTQAPRSHQAHAHGNSVAKVGTPHHLRRRAQGCAARASFLEPGKTLEQYRQMTRSTTTARRQLSVASWSGALWATREVMDGGRRLSLLATVCFGSVTSTLPFRAF